MQRNFKVKFKEKIHYYKVMDISDKICVINIQYKHNRILNNKYILLDMLKPMRFCPINEKSSVAFWAENQSPWARLRISCSKSGTDFSKMF